MYGEGNPGMRLLHAVNALAWFVNAIVWAWNAHNLFMTIASGVACVFAIWRMAIED